jgi:hypothetical protein
MEKLKGSNWLPRVSHRSRTLYEYEISTFGSVSEHPLGKSSWQAGLGSVPRIW